MAVDVRDIYGSQKIENLLNLALEATGEERAKSPELEVGFDSETKTWELIIKYSGDLKEVRELADSAITNLGRYRCRSIPAAGALLKEEDGDQMRLL